jgi:hypothetical protein
MELLPVGAELFIADGRRGGQTDMTKLIVAFRNFAKAPKNSVRTSHRTQLFLSKKKPTN